MSTQTAPQIGPYAGDISCKDAFAILQEDPNAILIDVRTTAEWNYVGHPDLNTIGHEAELIEWIGFPGGQLNPDFINQVTGLGVKADAQVLLLCRSGQRSAFAAAALTAAGYQHCYNISEGFEGPKDQSGHRNTVAGWRFDGLPWGQG